MAKKAKDKDKTKELSETDLKVKNDSNQEQILEDVEDIEDIEDLEELEIVEIVEEEPAESFLLVKIAHFLYALESSQIKEILHKTKVDSLPFMPSYISGIINRHGEPFVLFDPHILFGNEKQDKKISIIIDSTENYGIKVTEIIEFVSVKSSDFSYDSMFLSEFYSFSIHINDSKIDVLNPKAFLEYLKKDLKNY